MARLDYFTIIIGAICLAAAAFLVYIGVKKVTDNKQDGVAELYNDLQTYDEDEKEDVYYIDKKDSNNKATQTTTTNPKAAANTSNTTNEEDSEYDFLDEKPAKSSTNTTRNSTTNSNNTATSTRPSSSTTPSTSTSGVRTGDYMVLAGSFRNTDNAERQARKIRKLGYSDTRVERFNKGAYAVVLVEYFSDMGRARDLKNELTSRGVDSFVKLKK